MKLQQLPMGTRFEYQGLIYTKTGPMMATTEKGDQKLIPRYAVLKLLDKLTDLDDTQSAHLISESAVLTAFENFYTRCSRWVDETDRFELAQARQTFLSAIKKT